MNNFQIFYQGFINKSVHNCRCPIVLLIVPFRLIHVYHSRNWDSYLKISLSQNLYFFESWLLSLLLKKETGIFFMYDTYKFYKNENSIFSKDLFLGPIVFEIL